MQQQERDLIADLFNRLQQFESQSRDPEAERLIAGYVQRQPASPYLLVQTVLVQEEALKQARARIAELEEKAKAAGTGSSFLGSAPRIGPWGSAPNQPGQQQPERQQVPVPPPAQPWGAAPTQAAAAGGGGFMRSALATAAGVAGGALLFQGISSMFGHSTQALANPAANPAQGFADSSFGNANPLGDPSVSQEASDRFSSADPGQDVSGDYDLATDDSGFDSSSDDI
jgi:hypothetical protein